MVSHRSKYLVGHRTDITSHHRVIFKRHDAAMAEAEKMGMKIVEPFWTMGAYDVVVVLEAPDDETMSAFALKIGSLGSVKSHTMRAFRRNEMEKILAKIK